MAVSSFLSKPISDTDANFRAWGSGLSSAIQSVGFVKTADTGQINWLTVLKPVAGSTFKGYEIFRFNDVLQATAPLFIKIEYGSNIYSGEYPSFKTTVGKGSDGAGSITGVLHQAIITGSSNTSSSTDFSSYVSSGDGSMLVFSLWPAATAVSSHGFRFALERSRDANGNASGLGTFIYRINGASDTSAFNTSRTEAVDYITAQANVTNRGSINTGFELTAATTLNNGVNTPMFKAEVVTPSRLKWNPKAILGYAQADAGAIQTVNISGSNYLTLGSLAGQFADVAKQQCCCLAIANY